MSQAESKRAGLIGRGALAGLFGTGLMAHVALTQPIPYDGERQVLYERRGVFREGKYTHYITPDESLPLNSLLFAAKSIGLDAAA